MEREQIRISVRNLVEFILRSGDIDNRRASLDTMEAMQTPSEDSKEDGKHLPCRGSFEYYH